MYDNRERNQISSLITIANFERYIIAFIAILNMLLLLWLGICSSIFQVEVLQKQSHGCTQWKSYSWKFLKIHRKTLEENSTTLLKKTLAQVFSYEFCEIFKNIFFYRTPPVTASGFVNSYTRVFYKIAEEFERNQLSFQQKIWLRHTNVFLAILSNFLENIFFRKTLDKWYSVILIEKKCYKPE